MTNTKMQSLHRLLTPVSGRDLDDLITEIVRESPAQPADATSQTEVPLFVQAAQARAGDGMTAQDLLDDYSARLRQSTYPTLDCLLPEDVQRVVAEGLELTDEQRSHLRTCDPCTALLAAAQPSAERRDALMRDLTLAETEPR